MNKMLTLLDKFLFDFIGIGFLIIFLVNIVQIILRATSITTLLWSVDFSLLVIAWVITMGIAVAFHRNEHLIVGFVKERFPKKVELSIDLITRVILLIFFIILIVTGIQITGVRMQIKYTALGWSTGWAYLSLPVSALFSCLFILDSIRNIVLKIKNTK